MAVISKDDALRVIRRAFGPDHAASLAERLPERIDLDNPTDVRKMSELGVTRDRMFDALGAEL
jgi:hypothetical protein